MSVSFYLKNPKKLFRAKPVFTVGDCLALSARDITQFTADETDKAFDRAAFYSSPLSAFECLLCGVAGQSGRGFELSFDRSSQSYAVRVMTPSTVEDWQIALGYIKDLSQALNQPIQSEHGDTFSADTIGQFDFRHDIRGGLEAFAAQMENDDINTITLHGIQRPVDINAAPGRKILAAADPIAEFSRFYRDIQWLDAYSAKQKLYRNGAEIIGVYTLGYDVATILPYTPAVQFQYSGDISNKDISRWVLFVLADNNEAYELPYADAMAHLPDDTYRFIDATHILIAPLSKDALRALAAACGIAPK